MKPLLITPSLLNSFLYLFTCNEGSEEQAKQDFISYLKKEEVEKSSAMLNGIAYEKEVYEGKDEEFSKIVKGGCFQVKKYIIEKIDNVEYMLYGIVDVLKAGVIYDIKKVVRYERPKYFKQYQHEFYLKLFPDAKCMVYLVCDLNNNHYQEIYHRGEGESIENAIRNFIAYLKRNNLYEIYLNNWRSK